MRVFYEYFFYRVLLECIWVKGLRVDIIMIFIGVVWERILIIGVY